jgi:hypothetical protein
MSDFLARKRGEIAVRIAELRPVVEEYWLLQAAFSALDLVDGPTAPSPTPEPESAADQR